MLELDFINTWLGGHAITLAGLKQLIKGQQAIVVCEIGCGGGDNLVAIRQWCDKKGIAVTCIGVDKNPDCIAVAQERGLSHCQWITADYKDVQFDNKPDLIFSSLFCHHFPERELTMQLQWMFRYAGQGFFINDLHRHPLAYYSIQWLTRLFSKSYLVKNDAPLSVARGFVKNEWQQLIDSAGITTFSIQWKWAFRWLIVVRK
jgi:ubiquinone/menaquinone biosynthesis C-methylase UbiE